MGVSFRRRPTPRQLACLALALVGAALVAINRRDPDESRVLGVILLALGLALAVVRERPFVARAQELAVGLVLLLAGGELATRVVNARLRASFESRLVQFVPDPELRYELKPHVDASPGYQTNQHGMFDPPRTLARPPGTLRIACLGDSVGADFALPRHNACAALERVLTIARGGRPVEALNFSVPGYNTLQEARVLERKALAFAPDAVVVLYVINDPYPDLAIAHFLPGHLKFQHLLYGASRQAWARLTGSSSWALAGMIEPLYHAPRSWDGVVVRGFDRIRDAAAARGLPVVVAVFPLFVARPDPALAALYAQVAREAERHGFIAVDLAATAFRDQPLATLQKPSRDPIHPSARAHQLAAEAIARALLQARPALAER